MNRSTVVPIVRLVLMLCTFLAAVSAANAATITGSATPGYPVLLAKSWLIGYAIVGLSILLGTLAVLISSMRKVVRKKTS